MKKILILFDNIGPKAEYLSEFLAKNVGEGNQIVAARFADLVFEINGSSIKILVDDIDIKEFQLVYLRRADHKMFALAGTLALCLDKLNIKYFDTKFKEIGAAGDKFTSFVKLSLANLPTIPTFFCLGDRVNLIEDRVISKLGYPVIAKEMVSQHGQGIFVLRDKKDFEKLPREEGDKVHQYLLQKYVEIEKEYRLLVLGDKVVSAQIMKRDLTGFNAKVDMEKEEIFESVANIPDEMKKIAVEGARVLDIQVAGADLFIEKGSGKIGLLEINRGPGFTYDPKISPELPELAKFLRKELK
jgi:glutathione synthase/RimK-type ligase-like ATP-grasp enzyme